jgi:hypothetical protein
MDRLKTRSRHPKRWSASIETVRDERLAKATAQTPVDAIF